jgi:hypothetical protein
MRRARDLRRELSARNQQIDDHERLGARTDGRRNAERDFRTRRKPATREFPSVVLQEHLRKSGMGAPASQGSYRVDEKHGPDRAGNGGNSIARTVPTRCS